jgi:acetyl-CoA acetyltransferase
MATHYHQTYGTGEADLAEVSMQVRRHAMANPNAVMQTPLTLQEYQASRYIVRPLHLFDLCLVNDGGVCLIVRCADKARDTAHTPVLVAGWGEAKLKSNKMQVMVRERLRPQMQEAGGQALAMAGLSLDDIGHLEGYDASSIHLINQVEGYGFVAPGEGLAFCREGGMGLRGRLPVNTSGGNMSESYMHGWSQAVEVTRQLRHEAGARQIPGVHASMSSLVQTDQAHPILFERGA